MPERAIEIGDNVFDMLDADAQPYHFRRHAGLGQFLGDICRCVVEAG